MTSGYEKPIPPLAVSRLRDNRYIRIPMATFPLARDPVRDKVTDCSMEQHRPPNHCVPPVKLQQSDWARQLVPSGGSCLTRRTRSRTVTAPMRAPSLVRYGQCKFQPEKNQVLAEVSQWRMHTVVAVLPTADRTPATSSSLPTAGLDGQTGAAWGSRAGHRCLSGAAAVPTMPLSEFDVREPPPPPMRPFLFFGGTTGGTGGISSAA